MILYLRAATPAEPPAPIIIAATERDGGLVMGVVDARAGRPALGPGEGSLCRCDRCMEPRPAVPPQFQAMWAGNLRGIGGLHFGGPFRETPEAALDDLRTAMAAVGWRLDEGALAAERRAS